MSRTRDDEGSIAPLIPLVILALLLLGGLVVDGSRALQSRGNAQGYAEEAARAGATAIVATSAQLQLDTGTGPDSVGARVDAYCASVKAANDRVTSCGLAPRPYTNAVESDNDCYADIVQPLVIHTVVTVKINTTLLGIVGVQAFSGSGTGTAKPFEGTDQDNAC